MSSNASAETFMRMAYSVSCKGGESMLIMRTLWKTNVSFVKGILTLYVNFNISLTIVSEEKKKETLLSYHSS
jgi:hypothetical protein